MTKYLAGVAFMSLAAAQAHAQTDAPAATPAPAPAPAPAPVEQRDIINSTCKTSK